MSDFHSLLLNDVFKKLNCTSRGLGDFEAAARQKNCGVNAISEQHKTSVFKLFLAQFKDFMVLLLIAAAFISALIAYFSQDVHELFDTVIIVFIIVLNATVGFIQQYRSDKAIEKLKQMSVCRVKTRRNGKLVLTDSKDLVPGDIIVLEEGDMTPADCRLITSKNLKCDESSLTGESVAVEKDANAKVLPQSGIGDRKNMLFSSSFILGGSAEAVVVATGMNTEIGKIAEMLDVTEEAETPLQKSLNKLGKAISYGVIFLAVVIFALGAFFKHNPLIENFMSSVAVAVAAIPEGLPAVVTIIMAMGMQKMSRSKAIVRKLHAVETLGGCNFICSDKTGTLTQNKMKVVSLFCGNRRFDDKLYADLSNEKSLMLECMKNCSTVRGEKGDYLGDPTEIALRVCYDASGMNQKDCREIWQIPFDSNRKLMSVCVSCDDGKKVFTKGAPDVLLNKCSRIMINGQTIPLDLKAKSEVLRQNEKMASEALRVLGFAFRPDGEKKEDGLVFLGLAGMIDPPRDEVFEAVKLCKRAGIVPVMITGDHKNTAFAIAKKIGIANLPSEVITGSEIDGMSEEAFKKAVENCRVFARVSPKHKSMIVSALRAKGNVVAMTGDGINDAPSIKNADIGIAMGISGTDVTKNASDMIIADDNFATIVSAVKEGRRIFANIKKTIQFFLATNVAEVISIFLVSVFFCRYDFLLSAQLLWINLVTDSFPVLALGCEKAEKDIMFKKPERAEKSMFSTSSVSSIAVFGVTITLITLAVFFGALNVYGNEVATTMTFFTLSFAELFHAFNIKSEKRSVFSSDFFSNKVLLITVIGGILANVGIYALPALQYAMGVANLTTSEWITVFAAALAVIPVGEIYKMILRKKDKKQGLPIYMASLTE